MKRTSSQRGTHVLMFGLSMVEWQKEKLMVKGGLHSLHMGWSFTSGASVTAAEAILHIQSREDLEIVSMYRDSLNRSRDEMLTAASEIAMALSEHPHKPWVHIECPTMHYLEPTFMAAGLHVVHQILEHVIFDRWVTQIPEEKVA